MIRRDFRFSEDGDIQLGAPRTNTAGEILYVDAFGEESTDPSSGQMIRDIALHVEENVLKQTSRNRLKTDAPDWFHHPLLGGNLSDLIGESNTRATGEKGVQLIIDALTYEDYFSLDQLNVRAVPVNASTILFYVEVKETTDIGMEYPVLFDLDSGLMSEYKVTTTEQEEDSDA